MKRQVLRALVVWAAAVGSGAAVALPGFPTPGMPGGGLPGGGLPGGGLGGGLPGGMPKMPSIPGMPDIPGFPSGDKKDSGDLENLPGGSGTAPQDLGPILVNPNIGSGSVKPKVVPGDQPTRIVENLIIPSLFYSNSFFLEPGMAYYMPDEQGRDFRNFFLQAQGGPYSVYGRGGLVELSSVGFGYSAGAGIRQVLKERDNHLPKGTTYLELDVGMTFSLTQFRMSYLVPIHKSKKSLRDAKGQMILSVGIGLF